MARLSDSTGRYVDLRPLGYVFALDRLWPTADEFDYNWMYAQLTVDDGTRQWTKHGAGLPAFELQELVAWLRRMVDGSKTLPTRWQNTEQGITFEAEHDEGTLRLRCRFNHDFSPPERYGYILGNRDEIVELAPSSVELRRFAAELERDLEPFPLRQPPGRNLPPYRGSATSR